MMRKSCFSIVFNLEKSERKIKDGDTTKAGQIGLRPGIAVKLNDHFSFIAKYGFLGYRKNVNTSGDSFGLMLTSEDLSIGFHYNF